jgi:tetratricopeptide (TPR) repeat protein
MNASCAPHYRTLAVAVAVTLAVLAGCAGPSSLANEVATPRGDKNAGRQLYAGQPPVVHATEYPVGSAAEGLARGDDAWRQGNLDLAVYLYVQSLAFDSTSAQPFLKIAAIHERLGNRALAEKAFELALERDPGNVGASERLGLLYIESHKDQEAERLLNAAVNGDANRWRAYNGLGILADRRGDFARAKQDYDQAQRLQPENANVINNRGYSRYLAGDLAGAEVDLRLAISLGAPAGAWTNLAHVQAAQARYDEALQNLLREHDEAAAYNHLGMAALEAGDLLKARDYFSEAIRISPRYFAAAQENLAQVNERIEAAGKHPTRVTTSDAKVYVKGSYVGQVERGREVAVLYTQGPYSLVRYQGTDGANRTGWVTSAILAEQRLLH